MITLTGTLKSPEDVDWVKTICVDGDTQKLMSGSQKIFRTGNEVTAQKRLGTAALNYASSLYTEKLHNGNIL